MTTREWIEHLRTCPGDIWVVVTGYEEGYDDLPPRQISVVPIALNAGIHDWEGRHGDADDVSVGASDPAPVVEALVLHRLSN